MKKSAPLLPGHSARPSPERPPAAARTGNLPEPEPVTLGEAAHWNGETMNVRQGDVTMSLSLSGPVDAAALRAAAESLTKSALGRL